MEKTKLYTGTQDFVLAAGLVRTMTFGIQSPNRKIKIKSILLDWLVTDFLTAAVIPIETLTAEYLRLMVGDYPAASKIAENFTQPAGFPWLQSGTQMWITRPGQYFFESTFQANAVPITMIVFNNSAASIRNWISLAIETVETNIYQQ